MSSCKIDGHVFASLQASVVLQCLADLQSGVVRLQGQWVSPRVINLTLQYLTHAVKLSKTWKALKPHVATLLLHVVFPLLCFDQEDEELWRDDPHEYIRKVSAQILILPKCQSRSHTSARLLPICQQALLLKAVCGCTGLRHFGRDIQPENICNQPLARAVCHAH